MRTVAICQRALDLLCERVLSRETQGSLLARKEFIQGDIADSYAELAAVPAAGAVHRLGDRQRTRTIAATRKNIAAIKALTPKVVHDAVWRSMHAHGALGVSNEMPFGGMWMMAPVMSVVDGPTEVHKVTVAREVLKDYEPAPGLWPTAHLPAKREEAREKLADLSRARDREFLAQSPPVETKISQTALTLESGRSWGCSTWAWSNSPSDSSTASSWPTNGCSGGGSIESTPSSRTRAVGLPSENQRALCCR